MDKQRRTEGGGGAYSCLNQELCQEDRQSYNEIKIGSRNIVSGSLFGIEDLLTEQHTSLRTRSSARWQISTDVTNRLQHEFCGDRYQSLHYAKPIRVSPALAIRYNYSCNAMWNNVFPDWSVSSTCFKIPTETDWQNRNCVNKCQHHDANWNIIYRFNIFFQYLRQYLNINILNEKVDRVKGAIPVLLQTYCLLLFSLV